MDFIFDKNEKRKVIKKIINKNRFLRKTNFASDLFLFLSYVPLLFYFCFYVLPFNLDMKICLATSGLFVVFFGLGILFKILVFNQIQKDLLERTAERLTLQSGELIYSYRNKFETSNDDRIRIHIPIAAIKSVSYKKCLQKITLTGQFTRKHAENCEVTTMPPHRGRITSEKSIETFVIYDYFEESLYDFLIENKNVGNFTVENTCKCSPKKR